MKQRKKSLGIWIFLLLLFWGQWIVPVKASGPELRDVNMQMLGGQIRTITPMGLRMIGCIKKSYLQELESSGAVVEYGMVLLPKTYLGEQELELDRKYLYNGAVYKPAKVTAVKNFQKMTTESILQRFWQIFRKSDIKMIMLPESMQRLQERFPMKKDLRRKRQRLYTVTIQSTAKSIRLHRRQWTERQRQRKIRSGCGKTF